MPCSCIVRLLPWVHPWFLSISRHCCPGGRKFVASTWLCLHWNFNNSWNNSSLWEMALTFIELGQFNIKKDYQRSPCCCTPQGYGDFSWREFKFERMILVYLSYELLHWGKVVMMTTKKLKNGFAHAYQRYCHHPFYLFFKTYYLG